MLDFAGLILSALIAGIFSVIGAFLASKAQGEKQMQKIIAELSKYQAVNDERMRELTGKVEKHNSVIERTYELEKDMAIVKLKLSMGTSDKE